MKIYKVLALVLSTVLVFTSCIEMKETIKFNKKGGGTYTFTFNMTEMVELINSMEEDKGNPQAAAGAKDFTDGLMSSMDEFKQKISAVSGISDLEMIEDEENYTFGYSFDFDNVEALNNVMLALGNNPESTEGLFIYGKKGFTRTGTNSFTNQLKNELGGMSEQAPMLEMDDSNYLEIDDSDYTEGDDTEVEVVETEADETDGEDMEELDEGLEQLGTLLKSMENMSLTTTYEFPYKVKTATSEFDATIEGKKNVVHKLEFFKEGNRDKKTGLVVEFK